MRVRFLAISLLTTAALGVASSAGPLARADTAAPFSGNASRPTACARGDHPETGAQGEVTTADRKSGRSALGYSCNLHLLGQQQADGASWVDPIYGHCSYSARSTTGDATSGHPGVTVIDASDAAHPAVTATLTSPAMLGDDWESLKVNQARGLLAAVSVPFYAGSVFFDIYDVKTDCAHPHLLNSVLGTPLSIPANIMGHEGGWSPDGMTYWASGANAGSLTAIDVRDPTQPRVVYTGSTTLLGHGFDISPDGNRLYLSTTVPAGFITLDISQVQARAPLPAVTQIGQASFTNSTAPQHTIAITRRGRPWIIAVDEIGTTGIHFVEVNEPTKPVVHLGITLQIEQPQNATTASAESQNDVAGIFGYSPHYCAVDRVADPTALACGYFQAGIRVFDIRDLAHPREIAYFIPPGHSTSPSSVTSSYHNNSHGDPSVDWCTSPPTFRGDQLWVTCQDNGFLGLRFASGTYPLTANAPTSPAVAAPKQPMMRPPSKTPRTPRVAAPGGSLATTGASEWGPGLAVALVGSAALIARRRPRRRVPPGTLTVTLLAVATTCAALVQRDATPITTSAHTGDIAFARAMIAHHEQAIAMARAAETDARTSPIDRAFAYGIDLAQTQEVTVLRRWLRQWHAHQPEVPTSDMTMGSPGASHPLQALDAAGWNRTFLTRMRAHHEAAMPIIQSAMADGTPSVKVLAQDMRVQQTQEIHWIDLSLGSHRT